MVHGLKHGKIKRISLSYISFVLTDFLYYNTFKAVLLFILGEQCWILSDEFVFEMRSYSYISVVLFLWCLWKEK